MSNGRIHHLVLGLYIGLALTLAVSISCSEDPSATPSETPSLTKATPTSQLTNAKVMHVIDGATIEVSIDSSTYIVRYIGLEIPLATEKEALNFNTFLVGNKNVEMEKDPAFDKDGQGRLLRYVYINGEMVNEALLVNGYALASGNLAGFRQQTQFLVAQESARVNQRGVWEPAIAPTPTSERVQDFSGGTLPKAPTGSPIACDFSNTQSPTIKGNVDPRTGERLYHIPGGIFYETTVINESEGDRWFCTEMEALAAGWKPSHH